MDIYIKTIDFLRSKLKESNYLKENEADLNYRIEHSIRVANIGIEIAKKEGLNVEAMALGCILHDVGYATNFESSDDYVNHGRLGTSIARDYLESLALEKSLIDEICYGIAIHVDGKADFKGEETLLALTISDCDNIDRFDTYRIYDSLRFNNFHELSIDEKLEYLNDVVNKLNKYLDMKFATETATLMWTEKVKYQIEFYRKLKDQLSNSIDINIY